MPPSRLLKNSLSLGRGLGRGIKTAQHYALSPTLSHQERRKTS